MNSYSTAVALSRRDPAASGANLAELLADHAWRHHQFRAVYQRGLEFEQWYELRIYPQLEILRVFANRDRDMVVVLKNTAVEPAG